MTALRGFVLASALALVALSLPANALAHARYKSSKPGTGEVVQTSPSQVVLMFTQEVQRVSGTYGITVTNASGVSVTAGSAVIDDQDRTQMSVALQPGLPPGRYLVSWKNVSDADGDPFNAAFAFYVGVQPSASDQAADEALATAAAPVTPTGSESAGAGTTGSPSASGTVSPSASAPAPSPVTTVASTGSSGGGSHTGLFIGVAVVAVLAAGAGVGWFYATRKRTT